MLLHPPQFVSTQLDTQFRQLRNWWLVRSTGPFPERECEFQVSVPAGPRGKTRMITPYISSGFVMVRSARPFPWTNTVNTQKLCDGRGAGLLGPVLWVWKLRCGDIKWLTWGHTASASSLTYASAVPLWSAASLASGTARGLEVGSGRDKVQCGQGRVLSQSPDVWPRLRHGQCFASGITSAAEVRGRGWRYCLCWYSASVWVLISFSKGSICLLSKCITNFHSSPLRIFIPGL